MRPSTLTVIGRLALILWSVALGAVVLYAFFTTFGGVSPLEIAGATLGTAALAALVVGRSARIGAELRDPGGDPSLRDEVNRARERRGF